ncbi:hypothetical protein BE04_37695 [Sorangium cellulosum]|uniref:Uncharacterized protein n=1 Tax=Sorangium cellulosum TaxID=56 RepID=A0A150P0X6_SORCE|nr:hypothetical protein BE04_37695 [Sorangium cellulosum]
MVSVHRDAPATKIETGPEDLDRRQYEAWGVIVQTSNVRAVHVANGIMQLLRLVPTRPSWDAVASGRPRAYIAELKKNHGLRPGLNAAARALCVYKSKAGPLRLALPPPADAAKPAKDMIEAGCAHLASLLDSAGEVGRISEPSHRALADVLNADGKVMVEGGHDPTTPGVMFAGFSDTHTLSGMHSATLLGLLCATQAGRQALFHFYQAARSTQDPHANLTALLGLIAKDRQDPSMDRNWPTLDPSAFEAVFPMPQGESWAHLARATGGMALNITRRQERGATKAETLMSLVDLGLLILSTRMLRWERDESSRRYLLAVCSPRRTTALQQAVARAQESLRVAAAALDHEAHDENPTVSLIRSQKRKNRSGSGELEQGKKYFPSDHAINLASAGGWLFPLDARGGAPRYLCPGPRQLVTLVHALVPPGEELAWPKFAEKSEGALGVSLGGADDSLTESALRMGGVAATLREATTVNQQRLISLGLARRESDNLVIVDGGAR